MRKFFWCGAALAVAGAVAVYLATDYVQRGADSSLARAAGVSARLIRCNLVYQAGQMVANCAGPDRLGAEDPAAADEDSDLWIPAEPEPVADPEPAPAAPEQLLETIDVLQAAAAASPSPAAETSDAGAAAHGQAENRSGPVDPMRSAPQADDVPANLPDPCADALDARYRTMPCCTDEETDLPPQMPYATDEEGESAPTRGTSRKGACCPGARADAARTGLREAACPRASGCSPALPAADRGGHEEQDRGTRKPDSKSADQRLKELLRSLGHGDKNPRRSDLDTLEFRPSDARNGEFDRIPY